MGQVAWGCCMLVLIFFLLDVDLWLFFFVLVVLNISWFLLDGRGAEVSPSWVYCRCFAASINSFGDS